MRIFPPVLISLLALMVPASAAMSPKQEIEALLSYIGGLKGASFVRNGVAYPAPEAVAHLRRKWAYADPACPPQKNSFATARRNHRLPESNTSSDFPTAARNRLPASC